MRSPTAGRSIITNPSSRWKDSGWSTRRTWMAEQEEGGRSREEEVLRARRAPGASGRPGIRAHVARRPRRGRAHTHVHRPRAVRFAGRRSAIPGARHGGRAGRPEARHGQAAVPHAPRPRRRPPARLRPDAPRRGGFALLDEVDLGDSIGATGVVGTTRRGELSIFVEQWAMLTKSLRPLPEKWHGLKDPDLQQRRRYLHLIADDAPRRYARARAAVLRALRAELDDRGFVEFEDRSCSRSRAARTRNRSRRSTRRSTSR